jgi:membrane dipeptidase
VSTSWAGSSGDEAGKTRGLNDFGKQVIREMNRLGMMVDVSHLSDKAFWDIVNTSTKPVIATHSGCRGITNVPRNLTDEMIVALAKTGGVVNVIFIRSTSNPAIPKRRKRSMPKSRRWSSALPKQSRVAWRRKNWPVIGCAAPST